MQPVQVGRQGGPCFTSIYDLLGRDIIRGRGGHLNADDTLFYCQYFIVKGSIIHSDPIGEEGGGGGGNKEWMDDTVGREGEEERSMCLEDACREPPREPVVTARHQYFRAEAAG